MEAYKEGTGSYHSLYQPGCNPSRTNGMRGLPSLSERLKEREKPSLAFITVDPLFFSSYLARFEKISAFHKLLERYPDYDMQLTDLISDSKTILSPGVDTLPEIDSYSLYRMYRILAGWGDIRTRESLIRLCSMEKDSSNLAVLFRGLGKIGMDPDGRSFNAVFNALRAQGSREDLYRPALESCLEIALYNGDESMRNLLEIMNYVSSRSRSGSTAELIKKISRRLSP